MAVQMLVLLSRTDNSGNWAEKGRKYGLPSPAYRMRAGKISRGDLSKLASAAVRHHARHETRLISNSPVITIEADVETLMSTVMSANTSSEFKNCFENAVENYCRRWPFQLRAGGRRIPLERPSVMGVLNVTPDSFSDGGIFFEEKSAVAHGLEMAGEGADFIDVGGESTRPGASPVSAREEIRRVVPVIRKLSSGTNVPISVDTMKPEVAAAALDAGASILNDVSGLRKRKMRKLVSDRECPAIMMHMLGGPRTMQNAPTYQDVVYEVCSFISRMIEESESDGVDIRNILVDPGIGFGKTVEHNLQLLRELDALHSLGKPVVLGVSRKSFVPALTGEKEKRLEGSLAAALYGCSMGANIVRVHDVPETRRALLVWNAVSGNASFAP